VGQHRLAEAGDILDEQMAVGQQAGEGQLDLLLLAEDDPADLLDDWGESVFGPLGIARGDPLFCACHHLVVLSICCPD